jgi:hypothetical protein
MALSNSVEESLKEAQAGEELMYVDLSREKLEDLYNK